ncbi:hypothetical protein [Pedobacter ginsengisoli]|uniref:hypothetical protein n=1 Tax=Pedobacter ginsengisoli TaxID=363852 RepID=UPI00254CA2E1|nr:hypothetical protein [Pedobacter ginsengisoli]
MSIALTTPPPAFAFSGDRIRAAFTIPDAVSDAGNNAVNKIYLDEELSVGMSWTLIYGGKQVTITVSNTPDDSGTQLESRASSSGPFNNEYQAELLRGNYILQNDFIIASAVDGIQLIARKKGISFNIDTYNITPGVKEEIKPNLQVKFILYCENAANLAWENIYETELTVLIGDEGTAEAVLNDKLHDYMMAAIREQMPDIPGEDPLQCKKSCRRYYFEYAEIFGDVPMIQKLHKSSEFTVLHGGLSTIGQATKDLAELLAPGAVESDRFLKQGYVEQHTRTDQPQYLYFFNTRANVTATMKCKFWFTNGTASTIDLYEGVSFLLNRKYGFDIRFDHIFDPEDHPTLTVKKYEVWLVNDAAAVISESRFWILDYDYRQFYRYFLNWSSWGTFDSRMFYGKSSTELELVQAEAEKSDHNPQQISKGESLVFNISIATKFSVTTGFVKNKTELIFNRDFFASVLKYRVYNNLLLPIKVTSKSIPEQEDGNNLYAQKFEYEYLFDDHAYTEGDIEGEPEPPVHLTGLVYFGFAPTVPANEDDIFLLPNSQSPDVYGFPLVTGTNSIFVVATPPGKKLATAYNITADEDVTSEFQASDMIVDDLNYEVNVMQMAVAYTLPQTIIITLIDE